MKKYDALDDEDSSNIIQENELPDWMHRLKDNLGGKKLNEILIPGAHDAAMNSGLSYFKTQNRSITGLLESGVRFLDLRVRLNRNKEPITYHLKFSTLAKVGLGDSILLKKVMVQIKDFLFKHTGEIVIAKIKPDIWESEKDYFEEAIMKAIPSSLRFMLLTSLKPINQKYDWFIQEQRRFIIVYEKTSHTRESQYKGLLWNNNGAFMYSNAPKSSNYHDLIKSLGEKLPTMAETNHRIALFHWTLTGGNIKKNTDKHLSNMVDLKNKVTEFQRKGKRVNVIMMDFCADKKSLAIINMNIPPPILP